MKSEAANDNTKTALDYDEAVQVWVLRWQGWYQHKIAAHFGVNPARVNDVLKERKHVGSKADAAKLYKKPA
jgi:hypothetical protein